jgi:ribonuclease D
MEVTQHNFAASLPLVSESISNADFIAIDTEFSGKFSLRVA